MVGDYKHLVPPDSDFEIQFCQHNGRYMTATRNLAGGHAFLEEAPLAAWPFAVSGLFCEWCLRSISPSASTPCANNDKEDGDGSVEGRRVRPRLGHNRGCNECLTRFSEFFDVASPQLLSRWRSWQQKRAEKTHVGLEAFARCALQIAVRASRLMKGYDLPPELALQEAARPYTRLVGPPDDCKVHLDETTAKEIADELRASEGYVEALSKMLGSRDLVDSLISEEAINAMAGRLVLNAVGISLTSQPPGSSTSSTTSTTTTSSSTTSLVTPFKNGLRGAGIFVLLSTMNHDCQPSAEAIFTESSTVILRTTRPVKAGDPLTLGYVPGDLPLEERREKLSHWLFTCSCDLCKSEERIELAFEKARAKHDVKEEP